MKVGILTFINTLNYGAELQAYALRRVLGEVLSDVETIGYVCRTVERRESPRYPTFKHLLRHPLLSIREINDLSSRRKRSSEFIRFSKEMLNLGPRVTSQSEIAERYDVVVVGSDQIWNLACSGDDEAFFLGDVPHGAVRKISYAASFGKSSIPPRRAATIGEALKDFDAISVREAEGVQITKRLSGKRAVQVLDPTLLLRRDDWLGLCKAGKLYTEYVFAYVVSERTNTLNFARNAAHTMGLPLVIIDCVSAPRIFEKDYYVNDASPEEFLTLIRDATLVVTSSFHGLALSLALESEVRYSLDKKRANANSRLEDLARVAGIEDHEISRGLACEPIDFEAVRARLEDRRRDSRQFLTRALEKRL